MHPRMTHETGRWSLRWSCSCCDHPVPCVWQRVCHHHRGSIALRAGGHANPRPSILDATIPRTATRSFFQTIKRTDFSLSLTPNRCRALKRQSNAMHGARHGLGASPRHLFWLGRSTQLTGHRKTSLRGFSDQSDFSFLCRH